MRRLVISLLAGSLAVPALAQAPAASPGNLPPDFYPAPSCIRPDKTAVGKPVFGDPQQSAVYNMRVLRFNKQVNLFNACIRTYAGNAPHDIEQILVTVNTAVAEAQDGAPPPAPAAAGNMPANFYPRSPCVKPDRTALGSTPDMHDRKAMTAFNLKVTEFNEKAGVFNSCIGIYAANAQSDIQRVKDAVHAAVAEVATQ